MTPFWVLQTDKAPASAFLEGDRLILENRYVKRIIDCRTGKTVSLTDGDGSEAIAGSIREGEISVNGVKFPIEGGCGGRIGKDFLKAVRNFRAADVFRGTFRDFTIGVEQGELADGEMFLVDSGKRTAETESDESHIQFFQHEFSFSK